MTAKRKEVIDYSDLPAPPWVRPLSIEEQDALIAEAEAELDCGEGIPHEIVMREVAEMIAEAKMLAKAR